ncbi:hypothetical protein ACFLU5_02595 [Bacteroidota bacterium]
MAEDKKIERSIKKVLTSKHLSSGNDARLLHYLIEATQSGKPLKEIVIAMEVFGRDASFNPSEDSLVRSSIYGLRKNLDVYYLDEGKTDPVRITIPKGSYTVKIEEIKTERRPKRFFLTTMLAGVTIILLLVAGTFSFLYFESQQQITKLQTTASNSYVWADFLQSDDPLMIVLGDYFMLERKNPSDSSFIFRSQPGINNESDLWEYLESHPDERNDLSGFAHHFLGDEIPWCLQEITRVFRGYNVDISVKLSSELTFEDIRDHNIIFIGDFSTLGIFTPFFENSHYRIGNKPPSISYLENKIDTTEFISIQKKDNTSFQNDYVLISKIPGNGEKVLMFILSFASFGKSDAMYKLTEPDFPQELSEIIDPLPEYWELLIRVSGIERSAFYYEISHFDDWK